MTKSKTASTHTRVTRSLTATAADVVRPLSRLTVLTNQTSSQCVSGTSKFVNKKALPCSRRARHFWKVLEFFLHSVHSIFLILAIYFS